ncbi:MAG: hypothetical protein ACREH3_03945, partial [Geminicoccales bacterium]
MVVTGISDSHVRGAAKAAAGDPSAEPPMTAADRLDPEDFKLLLDASPAGVFRTGPDGNVIHAGGRLFQVARLAGA